MAGKVQCVRAQGAGVVPDDRAAVPPDLEIAVRALHRGGRLRIGHVDPHRVRDQGVDKDRRHAVGRLPVVDVLQAVASPVADAARVAVVGEQDARGGVGQAAASASNGGGGGGDVDLQQHPRCGIGRLDQAVGRHGKALCAGSRYGPAGRGIRAAGRDILAEFDAYSVGGYGRGQQHPGRLGVDYYVARLGQRAAALPGREEQVGGVSGLVPDLPAVLLQGRPACVVEVVRAVAILHGVHEHQRVGVVALAVERRRLLLAGPARRHPHPRRRAALGGYGDVLAELYQHVDRGSGSVPAGVIRKLDRAHGWGYPVDRNVARLAERTAAAPGREDQAGVVPGRVPDLPAVLLQGRPACVVEVVRLVLVLHRIHEHQRVGVVALAAERRRLLLAGPARRHPHPRRAALGGYGDVLAELHPHVDLGTLGVQRARRLRKDAHGDGLDPVQFNVRPLAERTAAAP